MTFNKILTDLESGKLTPLQAYVEVTKPDKIKSINYYAHLADVGQDQLTDMQLQELEPIVEILQILYSNYKSPISDSEYDSLQESLTNMGIPRLNGSIEINDSKKVSHTYDTLYGTLDKVYYLSNDEERTNKSRKTLDDWISSTERLYEKNTGKKIDLNNVKILVQAKYDGVSAGLEWDTITPIWITRGSTKSNKASNVSRYLNQFNDLYCGMKQCGQKFEIMVSEEGKDEINKLYQEKRYSNSRQVAISTMNSADVDFKADYLYPIPLRIMYPGDKVESIHPEHMEKFPTMVCTFGDRDKIREFANHHRYVERNGFHFRTDGAVMTIMDPNICEALGRDNAINNFEVAYKFTEETAYTKVKSVEFYVSEFGYITPVLVVNDVILKGNTVNHISLANKERFDELALAYGDTVKVLYDIIPYVTLDNRCERSKYGQKIQFVDKCPRCHEPLNLNVVQVQCKNPKCPSRLIGRVLNYCRTLRMSSIGYQTLDALWTAGFLNDGIISLYKFRKKRDAIEMIDGFGRIKTRKISREIEAKRRLKDYEFFGAYGIEGLSTRTFQMIFSHIKYEDFINMIKLKNWALLKSKLINVPTIGYSKAETITEFFNNDTARKELLRLVNDLSISQTFETESVPKKGVIVFTGCRPDRELEDKLTTDGYELRDSWVNTATILVIPYENYVSSKVGKAKEKGIRTILFNDLRANYGV